MYNDGKRQWLIAGLGNPGRKYANTRHNVGFKAIEQMAQVWHIAIDTRKFKVRFGRGHYNGAQIILAQPMAYMNCSGPPVCQLAAYFNIPVEQTLIVHDDIEIEKGRLKIKAKGGHGGHNGLKSISEAFGGGNFPRIRLGIGRPAAPMEVTDYVLGRFSPAEWRDFEPTIDRAEKAVATILEKGVTAAMNQFNMANEPDK